MSHAPIVPPGYPGKVRYWDSGESLDAHVWVMGQMWLESVNDPFTQRLAHDITGRPAIAPSMRSGGRVYRFKPAGGDACTSNDSTCDLNRLWSFIAQNVRYVLDPPHVDTFRSVRATLAMGGGDCDDHSILWCSLAYVLGYRVGVEVISLDGRLWEHVYAIIRGPRGWIPCDTAAPAYAHVAQPGWRYASAKARKRYEFLME